MQLFIDFETYYDEKSKYSLKHMTVQEYINDERFKVLGMSVSSEAGPTQWVDGEDCQDFFDAIPADHITFVAHNATFDASVAYRQFGFRANKYLCTMFMARYLISQGILPYNTGSALKDLAKFVGSEKLHLEEALQDGTLGEYAIRDTDLCRDFYLKYKDCLPEDEAFYIHMHVDASAIPKFDLDFDLLKEACFLDERRAKYFTTVRKDPYLVKALEDQGVTVEYKKMKKSDKPCFAKTDDFMKGLLEHSNPVVRELASIRLEAYSTCNRSKAARFIACGSPMSCPLIYYGAHTGRSGGTDNMNVQNMPRGSKVRTALLAPRGKKLVIIDSSQIEVRMLGFLAQDNTILDVFRRGGDIYKEFAANYLYHVPIDEVSKYQRQVSKAAVLALGFGQGANGFINYAKRMGVDIDLEEAQAAVTVYRRSFPKITGGLYKGGLWKESEQLVKETGYSTLPSGRKITYPNLRQEGDRLVYDKHYIFKRTDASKYLWHGCIVENIVQAAARDLVFWQIMQVLKKYPQVDLCLMVHDESIFTVPEGLVEEVLSYAEFAFTQAPTWASGIPVKGEGHISERYDK